MVLLCPASGRCTVPRNNFSEPLCLFYYVYTPSVTMAKVLNLGFGRRRVVFGIMEVILSGVSFDVRLLDSKGNGVQRRWWIAVGLSWKREWKL